MPGDTYPKFTVALFHLLVDQTPYMYTGVEFANRSRCDPLALNKEPEEPETPGEAEAFDPLRGAE